MSTCISKHGEYSEHGPLTDGYWCEWCGALDEAAMRKGIEAAVREQVAQDIEEARSQAPAWVAESHLSTWQAALANAARIARGEQS
jgi:hypothetical protein